MGSRESAPTEAKAFSRRPVLGYRAMVRKILEYLGHMQTWIWLWGIVATSSIGVLLWAVLTRLPGVLAFVLALGTAVLMLVGLETALMVRAKIKELRGWRYRRAVVELQKLRRQGAILRNRSIGSQADVKFFIADVEAFEAAALTAMQGAATHTDISWFQDLHQWAGPADAEAYNDEHASMKAVLDEKLRRMLEIAESLEVKIHS
jgi:hypothetical protein